MSPFVSCRLLREEDATEVLNVTRPMMHRIAAIAHS